MTEYAAKTIKTKFANTKVKDKVIKIPQTVLTSDRKENSEQNKNSSDSLTQKDVCNLIQRH